MLEKIELRNFKSHQFTQLNLDNSRLHTLVGQNSSGKTSILQALHYLSQLVDSDFRTVFAHQKSPKFIATIGQDNVSVSGNGFWEYQNNRKLWEVSYEFQKQEDTSWSPLLFWKSWGPEEHPEFFDRPGHPYSLWDVSLRNASNVV
jgi:predicted ATP-dependent endonuclease of OLD family